jgi:hypothetical protein
VTSVVRMVIIVQGSFDLVTLEEPTLNIGFVTSAVETNLAVITASAPALRPFLRSRARGGWLPWGGHSSEASLDVEMAGANSRTRGRPATTSTGSRVSRGQKGGGKARTAEQGRLRGRPSEGSMKASLKHEAQAPGRRSSSAVRVSDLAREIDGLVLEMTEGGRRFPERYYSESVYPDAEYRAERDFNEERLSRYGDRRFGVVTPKGPPPSSAWGPAGRPF